MTRHIIQQSDEAPDGRRTAAAASRNVEPIIEVLRHRLPAKGHVLEIASGTGQHISAFAAAFPALTWTPSDVDPGQRDSIFAWRNATDLTNLAEPLAIDIAAPWPIDNGSVQAVLAINLLHLVPEHFVRRFFEQAYAALSKDGRIMVYGPFLRGSSFASDGDREFDASLRARDSSTGYKSVEAVTKEAVAAGFSPVAIDAMPANNLLLTFVSQ